MTALVAVAVCAAGFVASQAAASGPTSIPVSGDYSILFWGQSDCHVNPPGFICNGSTTGAVRGFLGDLVGASTIDFTGVTDYKTGTIRLHGTETFTGSVAGVGFGTLTFEFHAAALKDFSVFSGRLVVKSSSGDLAGLHGTINLTWTTYEGELL